MIDLLEVWASDYQEKFLALGQEKGQEWLSGLHSDVLHVINSDVSNGWGYDDKFLSALNVALEK